MNLRILLILGALSAFGPLAIDMYLPSFPALAAHFGTDTEHVQLSLTVYFAGLAFGQLLYGPVADRYGRRGPMLFGVLLFALGSLLCAAAPSLEWLVIARFIQAMGGCAGVVISRAVVRDLCSPLDSARRFSQLMLVVGIAPILAPLAGGLLLQTLGWTSIFNVLFAFGALCLVAVYLWLPESLAPDAVHAPLSGALGQYVRLLGDRVFIGYALAGGVAMAGMFAYIAGSPFVFIQLYGVPAEHYGWLFGTNAAGFILFSQVNVRLLRSHGPVFWLQRMAVLYMVSSVALVVVALARPEHLWPLLIPLFICTATLGCIVPNSSACAMAGQASHAGSASALMGFMQFAVAALAAGAVGMLHDGTAVPMGLVICVGGLISAVLTLTTVRAERRTGVAQLL
jgi:DHA1 family bicyclomycin/chloramphenicol resistance-like MFS transporter